jgi:hypothetical protein
MDGQTDGHGETSIPPYNFVAAGMTKIYVIFIELCVKGDPFCPHEGEIIPVKI